jgi:hypothetical protein
MFEVNVMVKLLIYVPVVGVVWAFAELATSPSKQAMTKSSFGIFIIVSP